ncbi:MAG: hypothetical protein ACXVG9_12020, partial [Terriglobales bacterium]
PSMFSSAAETGGIVDLIGKLDLHKLVLPAQALIDFSDSPENQAKVELIGMQKHGVDYIPYHGV